MSVEAEKRLTLFVRRVEELRSRRLVKEGQGFSSSLNIDRVAGVSVRLNFPDEEDLRSFLLIYRQFISPNEPVHVNRICNVCFLHLKANNEIRDILIDTREKWKEALGKNGGGIVFEEQVLPSARVADLWINGYYFHNDMEKYGQLEKMFGFHNPFVRANFINFVVDTTRIIIHLGHLVAYALKRDLFKF